MLSDIFLPAVASWCNACLAQASVCCYIGISQSSMGDGWSSATQLGVGGYLVFLVLPTFPACLAHE